MWCCATPTNPLARRAEATASEHQAFFGDSPAECPLPFGRQSSGKPSSYVLSTTPARARIVPNVSFHVLRHTHASLLAMRAVPMAVITRQLGHADTSVTEKHYAHLAPNCVAETIRESFRRLVIAKPTVLPIGAHRSRQQSVSLLS
jgi:hypothetical protein